MPDLDDLPDNPTLEAITMLVGADNAALISMELGGKRVYIPHDPGEHSVMAQVVGLDNAKKISDIYGGMRMVVPVVIGRKAEILKLCAEGYSAAEIARKVRCSHRLVCDIRTKARQQEMNERQTSLPL